MWEAETGLQTRTSHNPHELRQLRTVLPGPLGGGTHQAVPQSRLSSLPSASSDWRQQHPLSSAVSLSASLRLSLLPASLLSQLLCQHDRTTPPPLSPGWPGSGEGPSQKIPEGLSLPGEPRHQQRGPKDGRGAAERGRSCAAAPHLARWAGPWSREEAVSSVLSSLGRHHLALSLLTFPPPGGPSVCGSVVTVRKATAPAWPEWGQG